MDRRPGRVTALIALLASVTLGLAACGGDNPDSETTGAAADGRVSIVAAFYPLEYAATSVGADAVSVTTLTPPGVEPHDLELSAAQVAEIAAADLVLYVKGFQPAVDEAVAQQAADRALDVTEGLPLLGSDPHVWLDPANMAVIGTNVGDRVSELAPDASDAVAQATTDFEASMNTLDAAFTEGLATCASRDLVVSHEAFAYLADAYDFTQVGISGLSPEAEPSPARLAEVAGIVRANDVKTIYYETLVDPKVAQTIADETGASTAVLDPLEGLAEGSTGDYSSVMQDNLATLVAGQSCS